MKSIVTAAVCGLLFGIGLAASGMVNPAKVQGFLDLFGNWDPSLAFVMGGAVAVTAIGYPLVTKRPAPVCTAEFHIPGKKNIDANLIIGSGIFGIGWGLVGFCPGPAFSSLSLGLTSSWIFVAAMLAGMVAYRFTYIISGVGKKVVREQTVVGDG